MENIFVPKIQPEKKAPQTEMEMRSLTMDKEKIGRVQPYFKLKSALQGSNEKFLQNYNYSEPIGVNSTNTSPAKVLEALLRDQTEQGSRGYYFRNIKTRSTGETIKVPDALRNSVNALPEEVRKIFIQYTQSQFDEKISPNVEQFNDVRREYAIKQGFWDLLDTKPRFEQLTEYITSIESQDSDDKQLVDELTRYALQYRRQNFLEDLFTQLTQPEPDFEKLFQTVKQLAQNASPDDAKALFLVASLTTRYELLSNKENIVLGINFDTPLSSVTERINTLPIRPKIGDLDPTAELAILKEKIETFFTTITPLQSLDTVTQIRESYTNKEPEAIFSNIDQLSNDENYQKETKNILLQEYGDFLTARGKMTAKIRASIQERIQPIFDEEYNLVELGKNEPAKEYLMENFSKTFFPLFQSLRGNSAFKKKLESYIIGKDDDGIPKRLQFIQQLRALEKQRPLTEIERVYIESVEQLTKFNPYLVGLSNEALGETNEYLRNHFDTLSRQTWDSLKDESYVPMLQIGSGPNGLSFFGEVARYRPDLAQSVLLVDDGNQPGGPFAIPNGPAWELNSANRRGPRQAVMPDKPGVTEEKTVRAFGSPVSRWYPGERKVDQNVRQGSINTTVDYFPTPDDLSTLRYPTNEELQIVLAIQSAMLFRKATLDTKLLKVSPNKNKNIKGDKAVTLERIMSDGTKEKKVIYTDAIVNSSGLGEPYYGFKIKGTRAERLLERTESLEGFPKISDTLSAFQALADRKNESMRPPRTIAMSGSGNSTDVLIEYLAELFASGNPQVRNVEKIYIVASGGLSQRPRYSKINDVKARNGKDNLIEFVKARISDVDFQNPRTRNPKDEPVVLYDDAGQLIEDDDGETIAVDAFIANAGFRSQLDKIYKDYLELGESLSVGSSNRPVEAITLPTNKEVAVGDQLSKDPNVIFVGTASNPDFDNFEKLAQLPVEAREALLRNGVENAVAIGFRAPDSQAAARIFIDKRDILLPERGQEEKEKVIKIMKETPKSSSWEVPITVNTESPRVANNVSSEDDMLSALLAYTFGSYRVIDTNNQSVSGEYTFEITKPDDNTEVFQVETLTKGGADQAITEMISDFLSNTYVQNYALAGFRKKRLSPKLIISLKLRNGKVDVRKSAIQVS